MAVLSQCQRKPLVLPDKGILMDSSLVFWAPLWHPHLSLSPFLTKDRYQNSCTVTGAVWTPQGRYFDGIDNKIVLPNLGLTQPFSVLFWYKPTVINTNQVYLTLIGDAPGELGCAIGIYNTGNEIFLGNADAKKGLSGISTYLTAGVWDCWCLTVAATNSFAFYLGGAAKTLDTVSSYYAFVSNTYVIGARKIDGTTYSSFANGTFGELLIYNRPLTAIEVIHIYLATKWRYQ